MSRNEALREFRALVARYGSCEWLGEIPATVFERMIELTAILVEAERAGGLK